MTKREYFIYTAVIAIVIWVGIFFISTSQSSIDNSYDKKIDSLKTLINVNNAKINMQESKNVMFENYINKIDSQFTVQQNKIDKLKKYYDIKIKAVDGMSNDSIYKSITNRYHK